MTETKTKSRTSTGVAYPRRFNVVFHNDDFTPMDFVIQLLIEIFNKNIDQASGLTMEIHQKGRAVAGTYGYEVAEQKTHEANLISRSNGHPLKITFEEL
jgi:ATP-dependent Clp protease adaptor protein ClpS